MLKVLFVLNFIAFGLGLLVYDIDYRNVTLYGNAKVDMFIKVIDIFYKRYGYFNWCDFPFIDDPRYRFCDIEIHCQACIMNQNLIGIRNPGEFEGYEKRTFSINSNRVITIESKNKLEFQCGSISTAKWEQTNSVSFYEPNLYLFTSVDAPYSDILKFTTYTGDDYFTGRGYLELFGIYSIQVEATRTKLQMSIPFRLVTYIPLFNVDMLEEYVLKAKCSQNYYGETCWYKCIDNIRIKCNCVFQEVYSNVPCIGKCNPGWIPRYVVYFVGGINEGITECTTLDLCYYPDKRHCDYPKVCLPVTNATRYCELLYVAITTNHDGTNVTSDVFLYEEYLEFSLEVSLIKEKGIIVNTSVHLNSMESVYQNEILTIVDGLEKPTIYVNDLLNVDRMINFTMTISLKSWDRIIVINKDFRINVAPKYIGLYHQENYTIVGTYIYIGETLFGNSSALPWYREVFSWKSENVNISFPFGNILKIQDDNDLVGTYLICNSTLIIKDRKNEFKNETFWVFIRPYQFFGWNKTNNVLDYKEVIKCQAKAFIAFQINITQLRGISLVNVEYEFVLLNDLTGGEYELVCYFVAKIGLLYSNILRFKLRVPPSNVCFFLHANVRGSIVQCGHDGFIQDEYRIDLSYYSFYENEWLVAVQSDTYLRIPYKIISSKFKIVCNITNIFDSKITQSAVILNTLFTDTWKKYPFSRLNSICLRFQEYAEIPKVRKMDGNDVVLDHYIFKYIFHLGIASLDVSLSLLILTSSYFTIFLIIDFLHRTAEKRQAIDKHNKLGRKKLKFRGINDILCDEAKKAVEIKFSKIGNFYSRAHNMLSDSVFNKLSETFSNE